MQVWDEFRRLPDTGLTLAVVSRKPFDPNDTVSDFLDSIWFSLQSERPPFIPPFTYGQIWLLRDTTTGKVFDDIGIEYCRTEGRKHDERDIRSIGIEAGATLQAIPVPNS
jgi:hypothetical protein